MEPGNSAQHLHVFTGIADPVGQKFLCRFFNEGGNIILRVCFQDTELRRFAVANRNGGNGDLGPLVM